MGWFGGGGGNRHDRDPTKSLDPALKEFLDSQQRRPYVPAEALPQSPSPSPPPEPPPRPPERRPFLDKSLPDTNAKHPRHDGGVPRESLFPDGRYAHLWSTYTPQDSITSSTTSPLERIVSARKDRRDLLHRAALENCAFEHELQQTCFTSGTAAARAKARLTMCREETRAFNRCYSLQGKFLQALGYMGRSGSTDEEEERIQMHADKLYHRMMDYEAAVDAAKRSGDPIPPLSSIFNASRPAPTIEQLALPPNMQGKLRQPLSELPPHERELAVKAALQEAKMTHLYTAEMKAYAEEMDSKRKERQRWMSRYFGEPIGKFVIPDLPKGKGPEIVPYREEELEREYWNSQDSEKK